MFFKTSVLKRLFKDAYKGAGLTVGHMTDPEDEEVDGYYISSGWWAIWFNNWTFPKEAKAAIIELCGELPQPGEVFKAIDGAGNQYEIEQKEIFNLPAAFERAKVKFRKTNILQQQSDRVVRILQEEEGRTVKAVSELFFNLINRKAIDYDNGEYDPIGPVATSKESQFLYWGNNYCYLMAAVRTTDDEDVKAFLKISGEYQVDYKDVFNWFIELVKVYKIKPLKVGYDRYCAGYLVQEMKEAGFHMDDVYQGTNLTPVLHTFEGDLKDGAYCLGENNLLRAHLLNVAVDININDSRMKPVKLEKRAHIDGAVSIFDALAVKMKFHKEIGRQLTNAA